MEDNPNAFLPKERNTGPALNDLFDNEKGSIEIHRIKSLLVKFEEWERKIYEFAELKESINEIKKTWQITDEMISSYKDFNCGTRMNNLEKIGKVRAEVFQHHSPLTQIQAFGYFHSTSTVSMDNQIAKDNTNAIQLAEQVRSKSIPAFNYKNACMNILVNKNGLVGSAEIMEILLKDNISLRIKFSDQHRRSLLMKVSGALSQLFYTDKVIGKLKRPGYKEHFYGVLNLFESDRLTLKEGINVNQLQNERVMGQ